MVGKCLSFFACCDKRDHNGASVDVAGRFSPLGPRGIDILIGRNKGVYFSENALIEPPPLLGQVDAIYRDNRAPLDFVESGGRRPPVFAERRDLIVVLAHTHHRALR